MSKKIVTINLTDDGKSEGPTFEGTVKGNLVKSIEYMIRDNTPSFEDGVMTLAVTVAVLVIKFGSLGRTDVSDHNIDALCNMAKGVVRKMAENKDLRSSLLGDDDALEENPEETSEGHVLN